MKKRNEDDPDFLGGLGDLLPAEVLKKINQLLEQLQQKGHPNQGSKIELVYVAPGAQHIDTQINISDTCPKPPKPKENTAPLTLPASLATEEAMALWQKVQEAGYVDANYQPLISRTQAALLADAMAKRLCIREKWKSFESIWNRKNMRSDYIRAFDQRQSITFQDELKRIIG